VDDLVDPEGDDFQSEPAPPPSIPSLREIVDEYGPQVWRTLRCCGVSEADIQDACQEVFLVVHRKIPEFEWRSSLMTWIYRICVRVAAAHRRKAYHRYEQIVADLPDLPMPPSQVTAVDDAQMLERLLAILDRMEPSKREVFVLYEMEGQTMVKVAETLGCPVRTAFSKLEAARKEVTRAWQRDELRGQRI
jgi:RNA polymerase sigma-70 factor (ECF subfamily)